MKSIYGEIPNDSVSCNLTDLIDQVFKLLPYKEKHIENLDYHFSTLLFRITGMCSIFPDNPELITIISILEAAKSEEDFHLYRKAILDSCAALKKMKERIGNDQ